MKSALRKRTYYENDIKYRELSHLYGILTLIKSAQDSSQMLAPKRERETETERERNSKKCTKTRENVKRKKKREREGEIQKLKEVYENWGGSKEDKEEREREREREREKERESHNTFFLLTTIVKPVNLRTSQAESSDSREITEVMHRSSPRNLG